MSKLFVHYRAGDGEIDGHEVTLRPGVREGWERAELEALDVVPDPKLHKVGRIVLATGETFVMLSPLRLIDKNEAERAAALMPTDRETRCRIFYELRTTDGDVSHDRPLTVDQRAAWTKYRQELRDLSKIADMVERVRAFPLRPDGTDSFFDLRSRLPNSSEEK